MSHPTLSNWANKNFDLYYELNVQPKKVVGLESEQLSKSSCHKHVLVLSSFL